MTGEETFELAAAIAGVCIGLAAILILSLLAVIGTWRLFRHASDASLTSTRAAVAVEEMARSVLGQAAPALASAERTQLAELRHQAEALVEQQGHLQEMARNLLDTAALEGPQAPIGVEELESAVTRLEATVGQMAASLANLIQKLEEQQPTG